MPYLTGRLTPIGAVVDVLIGVSTQRKKLLVKNGLPVPNPSHVRSLIDTGATVSGFASRVFRELGLTPATRINVLTPSTPHDAPHLCAFYDVSLQLVAEGRPHQFLESRVMAADCWPPGDRIEGLLGLDILNHCFFQFVGKDRTFTFAF
ncbi:MAG TPA: hypothetical protein VGF55_31045 [Gemmataceae bacterium]|jgi:hypothetical protein